MNTLFPSTLLLAIAAGWFALPLIPTIVELRRRREAHPLAIDMENDGEVRHFARSFKKYLESNFLNPALQEHVDSGSALSGSLSDGTPFSIVGENGLTSLQQEYPQDYLHRLVLFSRPALLPDRLMFSHGIYAAHDIECGREAIVRSLLGEHDVALREGSIVLRWLHAANDLRVANDCALYGRASAEGTIYIGEACDFERLHASRIVFEAPGPVPTAVTAETPAAAETQLTNISATRMSDDCSMVDQNLETRPNALITGNYVVKGNVEIGSNSVINGSLKSKSDMKIHAGTTIEGSLISGRDLDIGNDCRIFGPIVASRRLRIRTGVQIGSGMRATSVNAPLIVIESGVSVYGTVWARDRGRVSGAAS